MRIAHALALSFSLAATASAEDWPNWRGPRGDNISVESGWTPTGAEEPVWRAQVGAGYSSPVIADGRVYISGYFENEETPHEGVDRFFCLDEETGAELWSNTYPTSAYDNEHEGGALSTATVSEGRVYSASRGGEVRAYAAEDGTLLWTVDLVERHGVDPGRYGFASSPFVVGSNIVLNASSTVALDRETGETAWISDDYEAKYSTVAPIALGDKTGLVVFGAQGFVVVDAANGEHLHTFEFRKGERNVEAATPIVMGTRAFISSGYDQGAVLVDFGGEEPELLWRTRDMRNKMAGCTLWEEHFYGFDESMLKCIDLEGEEVWRRRGLGHGALSIADGRLLLTTSKGELVVAKASPEAFLEESRRKVIDDGVFWTAPVLANGHIFLRGSHGDLVRLDHRPAAGGVALAGGEAQAVDADALPAAAELERAYLAKSGLADAKELRLTGKLHVRSLGLASVKGLWEVGPAGRWRVAFDLPPGMDGEILRFFDGTHGWELNPFTGNQLIADGELNELRRTSGFQSLFDPLPAELTARTVGIEEFEDTRCYRVDLELAPDAVRHVYFDVESGLLAGRDSSFETTVAFGNWTEVGERLVPLHRTEFDALSGEERRWRFVEAVFEGPDEELFVMPEELEAELGDTGD